MSNFAIIDTRMSEKCKNNLKNLGLRLVEVPENSHLDAPISAHPDIFMFSHPAAYGVACFRATYPLGGLCRTLRIAKVCYGAGYPQL